MATLWDSFVNEFGDDLLGNKLSAVLEAFFKFSNFEGDLNAKTLSMYRYLKSKGCPLGGPTAIDESIIVARGSDYK